MSRTQSSFSGFLRKVLKRSTAEENHGTSSQSPKHGHSKHGHNSEASEAHPRRDSRNTKEPQLNVSTLANGNGPITTNATTMSARQPLPPSSSSSSSPPPPPGTTSSLRNNSNNNNNKKFAPTITNANTNTTTNNNAESTAAAAAAAATTTETQAAPTVSSETARPHGRLAVDDEQHEPRVDSSARSVASSTMSNPSLTNAGVLVDGLDCNRTHVTIDRLRADSLATALGRNNADAASVKTIASSSRRRRSLDTNASTRAIAESVFSADSELGEA